MRKLESLLLTAAALLLLALAANADADDNELCAPLIHLAKKDYASQKASGLKRYNSAPIYQMRMAARLVVARLTDEHKLLIRAAREGKLDKERLARELNETVVATSVVDLGTVPVSQKQWRWDPGHFTLNARVGYNRAHPESTVMVMSCLAGTAWACIDVDVLNDKSYLDSIEEQARRLANVVRDGEDDYVRMHVPAACFEDVGAAKVEEQGASKHVAQPAPEPYPMDEKLPLPPAA
ncbi:MAG: hypothetical protein HY075_13970 [Deltaproteobacteria bacterium]|nr:hypothetical protein [Deltaproteobacteria bacterium]